MGKAKATGVQNRHIYTRASYLYQAGAYLASRVPDSHHASSQPRPSSPEGRETEAGDATIAAVDRQHRAIQNTSRQVISDMRAVSLKVLIRQTSAIKKTICKFCDTLLVEGKTCRSVVENFSRGGRKPWADVLAIECKTCGRVKRFPVSASKQKRRPLRDRKQSQEPNTKQDQELAEHSTHASPPLQGEETEQTT